MASSTEIFQVSNFNPRTHVECDDLMLIAYDAVLVISIHAPTWGATRPSRTAAARRSNFNPRTHVGCDNSIRSVCVGFLDFNPRTHVGCDSLRDDV